MLFKRFRSPRVSPHSSPVESNLAHSTRPESPAEVTSAGVEAPDPGRSLASLMREEADRRGTTPGSDRYSSVNRILAVEGGARVAQSATPSGPALRVTSDGKGGRAPDVEVRFSGAAIVGSGIVFELRIPDARVVQLAGDFTDWRPEPMQAEPGCPGRWRCTMALPRGDYRYKFIVDGRWINDPLNPLRKPNPFGGTDSIVRVSTGP